MLLMECVILVDGGEAEKGSSKVVKAQPIHCHPLSKLERISDFSCLKC